MPNDYYDRLNIDGDERPLRDPDAQEQLFYARYKYPAITYCNSMIGPQYDANNNLFLMPDSFEVGLFDWTSDAAVVIITFAGTLNIYSNKGNKLGFTDGGERYMYPIYINEDQSSQGYIYAGGTFLLTWHRTGTLASGKPDGYFLIGDLQDARGVPYDNVQSALQADNVNDAIDELDLIKANEASLATVATSGDYRDLSNKPTIPAAQVNSDWNASSGVAEILNKPTIPTAASDISYDTTTTGMGAGDVQSALDNEYSLIDAVAVQTINLDRDKQDKLTAGSNISIAADNTISATDTKPGSIVQDQTGSVELSHNAWKQIKTFNLTKGLYIIHAAVVFQGVNSTGIRAFAVTTTSAATGGGINTTRAPGSSSDTNIHMTIPVEVTAASQTFYINAYQNAGSGVTLTAQPRFEYVKLR